MPDPVDYRLHDLLGVAGATVGFVLAGALLTGGFQAKYVHLFERYRALTGEFRMNVAAARRESLRDQIANYRRRIRFLNIASICIGLATLLFILTVTVASFSVVYPGFTQLRPVGTAAVVGGLTLAAAAVAIDLVETLLSRLVIADEVADIPGLPPDTTLPPQ